MSTVSVSVVPAFYAVFYKDEWHGMEEKGMESEAKANNQNYNCTKMKYAHS